MMPALREGEQAMPHSHGWRGHRSMKFTEVLATGKGIWVAPEYAKGPGPIQDVRGALNGDGY